MDLQDDQLIRLLADFKEHLSADIQNDLKVPSIVVLGAENNGKSSLLSRIIGMNILPVGNGVCTKCPIEVTVLHNPSLVGKFKLSIGYEKQERLRNETKPRSIKIEQCSLGSEAWKEYDNHEEMRDEVTKLSRRSIRDENKLERPFTAVNSHLSQSRSLLNPTNSASTCRLLMFLVTTTRRGRTML